MSIEVNRSLAEPIIGRLTARVLNYDLDIIEENPPAIDGTLPISDNVKVESLANANQNDGSKVDQLEKRSWWKVWK